MVIRCSKRGLMALAITGMLAGCSTYSLEELRHATPKGTAFQTALSKLYRDFAIQEEKDYDWFTSMYFADKGLTAAYGNDVEPEDPDEWDEPEDVLPTMRKAREVLVSVLNEQTKKTYPHLAARAQYYFDCWVEQQEENWQQDDIAICRNGLADAFERLGAPDIQLIPMVNPEAPPPVMAPPVLQEHAQGEDGKSEGELLAAQSAVDNTAKTTVDERLARHAMAREPKADMPAPAAPAGVTTSSYMVFFDDHRTGLPAEGKKIVDEIAKTLTGTADYSVVIGANEHVEFAEKRAESVKERLVESGVDADAITVSVARVPDFMADSGEGDSAPIRHRVEIYLNQ